MYTSAENAQDISDLDISPRNIFFRRILFLYECPVMVLAMILVSLLLLNNVLSEVDPEEEQFALVG